MQHSTKMASKQLMRLVVGRYTQCPLSQLATRSISYAGIHKPVLLQKPASFSLNMSRHIHEATLLETVKREIEYETEREQSLPVMEGFAVETQGTDITLKKSFGEENVTVTCNVNGSITPIETSPEAKDDEPDMVSTPPFTVTIERPGKADKLAVRCTFKDDTVEDGPDEAGFEIIEMTVHSGDWQEKTYSIYGDVIDGAMYDQIMEMLNERGINQTIFCDQLVDLATEYEHKLYIALLKSMDKFLS